MHDSAQKLAAATFLIVLLPIPGCGCDTSFTVYTLGVTDEEGNGIYDATITVVEGKTDPEKRGCYEGSFPPPELAYCLFTDGGQIDGLYERLRVRVEKEGYESVTRSFLFKSGYCHVEKVEGSTQVTLHPSG